MTSTTAAAFSVAPSSGSSRTARPTTATVVTADAGSGQRPNAGRNQDGRGQRDHADGLWKRQVAVGVLIHQSEFLQSNAVVVQGRAGVLLIDAGITSDEMAC